MDDEYPSEEKLEKIKTWKFSEETVEWLIELIRDTWHWPDWGFSYRKQEKTGAWKLALHTGGWSGNESIISALEENFIFWSMFWKLTRRGGHYYFDTELTKKKWDRKND
jgi:hypothetical protein